MNSFKKNSMDKKSKLVILILLNMLSKILVIFTPYCLERMIDSAVSKSVSTFNYYGVLMSIFAVTNILLQAFYSFQLDMAQEETTLSIKERIILSIRDQPFDKHKNHNISYYYQRFTKDIEECRFLFYEKAITEICNVFFLILLLLRMFQMSPELSLIIIVLIIFFLILKRIMLPIIEKRQTNTIQSDENMNCFFEEYVSGQETIRNYKKSRNFLNRFSDRKIGLYKSYKENTIIETLYDIGLMISVLTVADILINWIGGYHIILGRMTIGMLTAYTVYFYRLWDVANSMMSLPKKTIIANVSLKRINEILYSGKENLPDSESRLLPALKVIRFEKMSYAVGSQLIFSNYSSSISFGQSKVIGIIGANGSGKSTLAKLINKSIIPTSGNIYYNNIKYEDIPEQDIKSRILLVPADSYLFEGTIRDNILFFSEGELSDRVNSLLALVGLNENEYLKQNGSNISNGQKKIIEICRSFSCNQEMIIYDEPTNFVDERIKVILIELIKEIAKSRKIIVITHDPALIQNCTTLINLAKPNEMLL